METISNISCGYSNCEGMNDCNDDAEIESLRKQMDAQDEEITQLKTRLMVDNQKRPVSQLATQNPQLPEPVYFPPRGRGAAMLLYAGRADASYR